jgi:uncharacterized protein YbgA (DUF1722 family)
LHFQKERIGFYCDLFGFGLPFLLPGKGFFARAVAERYVGFPLEDEGRLINKKIREHFLTRLFLFSRFREAKKDSKLPAFHERNLMLFKSYNEKIAKALDQSANNHFEALKGTVRIPPTSEQVYKFFKSYKNKVNKDQYGVLLEKYRENKVSIETIAEALRLLLTDMMTLESSFFNPFPLELKGEADEDREKPTGFLKATFMIDTDATQFIADEIENSIILLGLYQKS